jgi:putative ATP-binding cassette transporter
MINEIQLVQMYRREVTDTREGLKLLIFLAISSIANTLLLVIVNNAAPSANSGGLNFRYFLMFTATLLLFIYTQRFILTRAVIITEEIINRVRTRIGDKARQCDLYDIERLGHSQIYSKVTKDAAVIQQSTPHIVDATQSLVMVVLSLFYLFTLSKIAFYIATFSIIASIIYYLKNDKIVSVNMRLSLDREVDLFGSLSHILDGFKEIKMNKAKSDHVMEDLRHISEDVRSHKTKALIPYADNYIFSVSFFYVLLGIIIFVLPNLTTIDNTAILKLTTAILFIVGPLSNVVSAVSQLTQSNMAIHDIYELEKTLEKHRDSEGLDSQVIIPGIESFKKISTHNLYFEYTDRDGSTTFSVGPVDLEINRNEVLYIIGGNGSGKSTFLKLLTSLYYPKTGYLKVDDTILSRSNVQSYRELYSIIFSEFHLFDKLYGLSQIDEKRVYDLLKLMEIETKTNYKEGRFTNLELSTGQRKRLALVVTYLEDKEIYVFDEWAADQDPHFREYFYKTLIPDLQKRGKTVIAVTHDDRYFKTASRVLKMDFGKVHPYLDNHHGNA